MRSRIEARFAWLWAVRFAVGTQDQSGQTKRASEEALLGLLHRTGQGRLKRGSRLEKGYYVDSGYLPADEWSSLPPGHHLQLVRRIRQGRWLAAHSAARHPAHGGKPTLLSLGVPTKVVSELLRTRASPTITLAICTHRPRRAWLRMRARSFLRYFSGDPTGRET